MQNTSVEWMRRCLLTLVLGGLGLSFSPARGQTAGGPAPVLSADVNGARTTQVFSGWPLLLRVRLIHPRLFAAGAIPITLASDGDNWARSLRLEIRDANGTILSWPFALLNSPASTLLLDSTHLGELFWCLSPAQTAALAPGDYTVSVIWDSRTVLAPLAWRGLAQAVPLDVRIGPELPSLSPVQHERKQLGLADYHLTLGDAPTALAQVDALLASDPNNIGGLSYRGAILRRLGRTQEALEATHLAIAQVAARYPDAAEPPRDLLAQQFELTQLLLPGRLNSIAAQNGGGFVLDWNAIAGEIYRVESSRDFTNWTIRATGLRAETNALSWATTPEQDHEFFRIGQ